MTERAKKIMEAYEAQDTYNFPKDGVAAAIRAIVSDYESWEDGTYMVKSNDILEIADELEAL